jgi:ABC-type antimicrobial peptide transport system permease subunit
LFVAGTAAGLALAFVLLRAVAGLVFGVTPADPAALAAAILLLAGVTVIASAIPAIRAARVDPTAALRYE